MASTDGDLTVAILREIRDEIRTTNERMDALRVGLSERIDGLSERQDRTNDRLDLVVQEQIRLSTGFVEMQEIQRETAEILGHLVREMHQHNERLDNVLVGPMGKQVRDHERRLGSLEERVEALTPGHEAA